MSTDRLLSLNRGADRLAERPVRSRVLAYAVALAATLLALGVSLALDRRWEEETAPFPLFLAAVMLSSWYGGLGPGLLSTAVGAVAMAYFFVIPTYSLRVATLAGAERLAVSVLVALLISSLNLRRERAEQRLRRQTEYLQALARSGRAFSAASLSLQAVLDAVIQETSRALRAGCALQLHDDHGLSLEPDAVHPDTPETRVLLRGMLASETSDATISPRAGARDPTPGVATGFAPHEAIGAGLLAGGQPHVPGWNGTSLLVIPLQIRGHPIGRLLAWREVPGHPFSADDQLFLLELADRAALAIDSARQYDKAQQAEARYRGLFEGAEDAILVSDVAGRLLEVNPAATAILGYSRDELLRLDRDRLLGNGPLRTEERARLLATGRWFGELDVRRKDGSFVPVEAQVTPVRLSGDVVVRTTLRDISARRALELAQQEFLAAVSHDLRTPLTGIRSGIGLLAASAGDRLTPDERRLLSFAQGNTRRLDLLIGDLLALNQLDVGTLRLDVEELDARTIVIAAQDAIESLTQEKGQTLDVRLDVPLPVEADARRLEQVFVNLLSNAHEHTPPGTRIEVTGGTVDGEVVVTISDDGPGVPEAEREAIFRRFYRVGTTGSGSGLGLAIAKSVVELHRGRIWVESGKNGGSTFHVALPRCRDGGGEWA